MIHPPCHGAKKGPSGSLGDLLTRLGFVRPHHAYGHGNHEITHHTDHDHEHHEKNEWKVVKAWKNHVEHMVGGPIRKVPEEGFVRILPFTDGDRVAMEESARHGHGNGNGHLRGYGGHQWVQSSFTGRYVLLHLLSVFHPQTSPFPSSHLWLAFHHHPTLFLTFCDSSSLLL